MERQECAHGRGVLYELAEEEELGIGVLAGVECFERRAREFCEVRQGGIALTADEGGVATEP